MHAYTHTREAVRCLAIATGFHVASGNGSESTLSDPTDVVSDALPFSRPIAHNNSPLAMLCLMKNSSAKKSSNRLAPTAHHAAPLI